MSLDTIPPWISVGPQSFGDAAATGARLDLARQQTDTQAAMDAVRLNIQKTQSDRDFAIQNEQHALDAEMKRSQLQMAATAAARKYQAQNQYQQLVAGGMEPAQAMLHVGPSLGISMVGAGQLSRWGQAPPPPQHVDFGNGQGGGTTYNHRFFPDKPTKPEYTDETIDGNLYQRDSQGKLTPVAHGGGANSPGAITPQQKARINVLQGRIKMNTASDITGDNPALQKQILLDQQELDKLTGGEEGGAPAPAGTNGAPPVTSRYKIVAVQ